MKKNLLLCFPLFIALTFTSCDNFLNGNNIRQQLEKQIEYNNTEPYTVYVDAQKDTGIITKPAGGEAEVKPSDTFNLSFNCDTSYQFIKWQAYDSATGENIDNDIYLKIEDPQQLDTTCSFLKIPDDPNIELAIYAVVAKRPQIFFYKPNDSGTGSPAFTDIQVFFDQFNMDPDNIYYTKEEMQELKETLNLQDEDFLQGDETLCGGRYYGYQKKGNKYFKNIQIVNYEIPTQNMAKYFCNPYWEKEPNSIGGSTLVIQTAYPAPPKGESLYVSLSDNFCYYYKDGIPVKLLESKAWPYKIAQTSNDQIPPEFIITNFNVNPDVIRVKVDNGYKLLQWCGPENPDENPNPPLEPPQDKVSKIPTVSGDIILSFNFGVTDEGGSGIANRFRLCYVNPVHPHSDDTSEPPPIELPYLNISKNQAYTTFSDEYLVKRTNYVSSSGYTCFTIEAIDNDGNTAKFKYKDLDKEYTLYYWIKWEP